MKLKGRQDIEYWVTRGRSGQIIRVYQVDRQDLDPLVNANTLTVPILVDYMNQGESLADILEERDKLKVQVQEKGMFLSSYWLQAVEDIQKKLALKKKWWEFWK